MTEKYLLVGIASFLISLKTTDRNDETVFFENQIIIYQL